MKKVLRVADRTGSFAENKDIARRIRLDFITVSLKESKGDVILDFAGVTGATQSFIHALISQLIRDYGDALFQRLLFKNCNVAVQQIINTVADYMAES